MSTSTRTTHRSWVPLSPGSRGVLEAASSRRRNPSPSSRGAVPTPAARSRRTTSPSPRRPASPSSPRTTTVAWRRSRLRSSRRTSLGMWSIWRLPTPYAAVTRVCWNAIDVSALPPAPDGTAATEDDFIAGTLLDCASRRGHLVHGDRIRSEQSSPRTHHPRASAGFLQRRAVPPPPGQTRPAQEPAGQPRVGADFRWRPRPTRSTRCWLHEGGVDRAFRRARASSSRTSVWWEAGAQPPQLLADGEVVMTSAYNGRLYNAIFKEKKRFVIIWDAQVWDVDYWGIVKGTARTWTAALRVREVLHGYEASRGPGEVHLLRTSAALFHGQGERQGEAAPAHVSRQFRQLAAERFRLVGGPSAGDGRALHHVARKVMGRSPSRVDMKPPMGLSTTRILQELVMAQAAVVYRGRRRQIAQGGAGPGRAQEQDQGAAAGGTAVRLHRVHLSRPDCAGAVLQRRQSCHPGHGFRRLSKCPGGSGTPAGAPTPPEAAYAAMGEETRPRVQATRTVGKAATRLNYAKGGMRSLMSKTARKIARVQVGPFMEGRWKEKFLEIDKKMGGSGDLDDHQVHRRSLYRRPTISRQWTCATTGTSPLPLEVREAPDLPDDRIRFHLVADVLDQRARHHHVRASRLSGGLPAGQPAVAIQQPADDPGAAALLDIVAGTHHRLDRRAADRGGAERRDALPRHPRRAHSAHLQPVRGHHIDDPHSPARS